MCPPIDAQKTGCRIHDLMKENNVTVRDVRDQLCLQSVQSIYQWLNGHNLPSLDNLYAMSVLFGVPMDEIVCAKEEG